MKMQLINSISTMLEASPGIDSHVTALQNFDLADIDMGLRSKITCTGSTQMTDTSSELTEGLASHEDRNRIFCYTDSFGVDYAFVLFHEDQEENLFQIGPCLLQDMKDADFVPGIMKKNRLAPEFEVPLTEYYYRLPFVKKPVYTAVINAAASVIFSGNNYDVVYIDENLRVHDILYEPAPESASDLARVILEERYNTENQMMRAIARGDRREALRFLEDVRKKKMRPRSDIPLRDDRNFDIILNTLCRKAAESGGVHPVQINAISRDFALLIEKARNTEELNEISLNMMRIYTSAVSHHSYARFSTVISIAMNYIANHLDLPLSLKDVAGAISVHPGYLSAQFKRETGITLTDYIRAQKIEYASILLTTTTLHVQSVAEAAGFYDVQYFSRLFKREKGSTPSAYRQAKEGLGPQLRDSRRRMKNEM